MENEANILVVDTRYKEQYDVDHVKGAVSAPLSTIMEEGWVPPTDKEIILYCGWPNEDTSARAALELINKGFSEIKVLKGGYDAWKAAGYPMETGANNEDSS